MRQSIYDLKWFFQCQMTELQTSKNEEKSKGLGIYNSINRILPTGRKYKFYNIYIIYQLRASDNKMVHC